MTWTMAIETGGTFTDLFMIGPDGRVLADKVPSTPAAPERAVRAALLHGLELAGTNAAGVGRLLHGSTVAVNALIERKASLPAVIATRGFRDMLFIGRQDKIQVYDFAYCKPEPFTDRALVFEVGERLGPDGTVVTPLDDAEVAALVDRIAAEEGVASVAVCLLHSYANPAHEQRIAEILAQRQPHLQVTLSSDVCPVHREYERTSTTVINAFLRPVVDTYLGRLETLVAEAGCTALPLIMQANGGVLPVSAARRRPAELYLSGPAAAVAGAARLARDAALPSLITLDVGGTSSDICIVTDGAVAETGHGGAAGQVQHQPLNMVMTDIVTIGAGGGSLAWVDGGGMLKVGPLSAGADPGPACYGRGGTGYALTDALLNLGLLADGAMLPGGIRLDGAAAEAAGAGLRQTLGLDTAALAEAVFRIAVANMAEAIRTVTLRRGLDPRDYALFACGGAGPLVATALAAELEVETVLVPPDPGVFSAFGLTAAGLRMDFATALEAGAAADAASLAARADALREEAAAAFAEFSVAGDGLTFILTADARYKGQGYELRVPLERAALEADGLDHVATAFHEVHAQRYGHGFPDQGVEVVALRLAAIAPPPLGRAQWQPAASGVADGRRRVTLDGGAAEAAVRDRAGLPVGQEFRGPLLVVEPTTTTIVHPGWTAEVTGDGVLQLRRR